MAAHATHAAMENTHSNNDYLDFSTAGQGDTYRLVSAEWQNRLRLTSHPEPSNKSHDEMSHDSSSSCATDVGSLSDHDLDNSDMSDVELSSGDETDLVTKHITSHIGTASPDATQTGEATGDVLPTAPNKEQIVVRLEKKFTVKPEADSATEQIRLKRCFIRT